MNIGKAKAPNEVMSFDPKKRVMRCGFSVRQSLGERKGKEGKSSEKGPKKL